MHVQHVAQPFSHPTLCVCASIAVALSSAVFDQIGPMLREPILIPGLMGQSLPGVSTLFATYILFRGMPVCVHMLLACVMCVRVDMYMMHGRVLAMLMFVASPLFSSHRVTRTRADVGLFGGRGGVCRVAM